MALKFLKINVSLLVKGDPTDTDDLKDRVYENLQLSMEDDNLEFVVEEDEDESDVEE